jgi:uncharacterized protein YcbX
VLAATPVKGTRIVEHPALTLTASGVPDNRRFFLVDERGWLVNGKHVGELGTIVAGYADPALTLTFPDGAVVAGTVAHGDRSGVDRGRGGAVSLISRGSLDGLARVAGEPGVDARRFRMLVEIDGVDAHAEDAWVGARVRIGRALVRFRGHVGRCSITTRDPESGVVDLPTLDLLRSYRGGLETTEPLAFGVYGEVLEGGRVAVGDPVSLV